MTRSNRKIFTASRLTAAAAFLMAMSIPAALAGDPLDDPIPEPIPLSRATIRLVPVADGLSAPNWATFAPGFAARALFVTDQDGELWEIDLVTGRKRVFLDVRSRLVPLGAFQDERGLLGVAFHPDYIQNGLLYTYTSQPTVAGAADFSTMPPGTTPNHQSVVTEWAVPDPTDPTVVADPASAREILRVDEPQANHNGGALAFGPDGLLYIALGDGGAGNDQGTGHGPLGNGQDPATVVGAILRIDPLGDGAPNGQYGIPLDNPGIPPGAAPVGGPAGCQDGFCDEIFAYGLRNPFRFSFDSRSGLLVAADVGQNDIEEIDVVIRGGNYGWNLKEGSFCSGNGFVSLCDPGQVPPDLLDPVAEYDHDEGTAVIGGFVYRGSTIPPLNGIYVFGDYARGFLGDGRLFFYAAGQIREFRIQGQSGLNARLLGFGQDAAGEIYVLTNAQGAPTGSSGEVLRIAPPTP